MIFNTYKGANAFSGSNGPILLAHSDCWGSEPTKKPPVLLGYNGAHYENLIPMTVEDERKTKVLFGQLKRSELTLRYEQFSIFQDIEEEEQLKIEQKRRSWANVVKGGPKMNKSAPVPAERDGRKKERAAKKEASTLGEKENIDAGQKRKLDRQESLRKKPSKKKQRRDNKMDESSGAADLLQSESPSLFESNTSGRLLGSKRSKISF